MIGDIITFVPYSHVKISLNNNISIEYGTHQMIQPNISHPNDIVSYEWKEENRILGIENSLSIENLSIGTHAITLTIVDINGLSTSVSINIQIFRKNTPPEISIEFPQCIFTDTNMSEVNITIIDPESDDITESFEWKVNDVVVSNEKTIDNFLFEKHDILTLKVTASDSVVGNAKTNILSKSQEVLNSRPVIELLTNSLILTIGDNDTLIYNVTDADNDNLEISWINYLNGYFEDDWVLQTNCQIAIEEYDIIHPNHRYNTLTEYEKEDFNNTYCIQNIYGKIISYEFINGYDYTATTAGKYIHKMTVSDGEYNRTAYLEANITRSDIIGRMVNNHDQYEINKPYNVYMKDFNNDGNKDLIYITYIVRHDNGDENIPPMDYEVPQLIVELRNGDVTINKYIYDINNFELEDFYVNDINGDHKLDIVFSHSNGYRPPTNNRFTVMYQDEQALLNTEVDMNLSNYSSMFIGDVLDNAGDEIVLSITDGWNDFGIKIYGVDVNKTVDFTLPNIINHHGVERKVLTYDMDNNGKKDIIIANKSFRDENNTLTFMCSILSQDTNGNFNEQQYEQVLKINLMKYSHIHDIVITDILDKTNIFVVATTNHVYFLELVNNHLEIIKVLDYFNNINYTKNTHMNAELVVEDINHDLKKDILLLDTSYAISQFLNVYIQTDNNFLTEQSYSLSNYYNGSSKTKFTFGDINNDSSNEIFLSAGDNNLSTIYFK
jgi:hypothetical protein